jgi:pimeloyl-ACP methyl ester carboxylesterase
LYNSKGMADDLAEILDHEGIKNIVSVGHDWGAFMAQRMWLWHPDRVTGVILLNVAYHSPSAMVDLDKLNELAIKMTGLPRHSYWYLFTAPDGAQVLQDHIESLWTACHGNPENWLETLFCHPGAMEDFLRSDKLVPLKPYAEDPKLKDEWIARHKKDGFQGPVNWYIAQKEGHHWAVEKELPKERFPMTVPVLFIGASEDTVCRTEAIYAPQKAGLLPDLTIKEIKSGHWQTLEVPDQTGPLMAEWLTEKEGVLSKAKV